MFTYYILCCNEYEHRYGKIHGAKDYWDMLREPPKNMPSSVLGHTPVPQAMKQFPECMVEGDTVQAYRNFYNVAKKRFATWKERERLVLVWNRKIGITSRLSYERRLPTYNKRMRFLDKTSRV